MRPQALAILSLAGSAPAQAVTSQITPSASAPAGCTPAASGTFEIAVVDADQNSKRGSGAADAAAASVKKNKKRATCDGSGVLVATLADGVMMDAEGRTAYIASNYQFQFDNPPQAGAIYTAGFSVCDNSSLALGGSTIWYKCLSGDFYNLYDRSWAAQCSPAEIAVMSCGDDAADADGAGQGVDATTVGTVAVTTTLVSLLSDGQPQVITATVPIPMCQIGDGQAQAQTTPCASITGASSTGSTTPPASEYSDGQVQVTTSASDATPEATGGAKTTAGEPYGTTLTSSVSGSAEAAGTGSCSASTGLSSTSAPTISSRARANAASLGLLVLGLVGAAAFL